MTAIQPIDKKFLEDVLGEPVSDIKIEAGCKAGDNVAGSLKSITATTAKDKKQHHFVFKTFPEHMTQENGFVIFMKAFWREHAAYKTVLPALENFAKSKGFDYVAPAPKYYKGHNDDKNDYLLLEDMRPSGYKMPDKTISLTLDETSLIMEEFAKFHAVSYAYLRHEGERVFQEIDGFQFFVMDDKQRVMIEESFDMMIKLFFSVAADVLEKKYPEGTKKMRKYMANAGKLQNTMEHLTDKTIFPTICHFDLWSNNMLIKHDDKGHPVGVKFIDFQFPQRGNIFSDLSYTLYTSTTPEFRKKHLLTILNLYYDEFSKTLEAMKVPLPCGFTRGFFIDTFQSCIAPAFVRMTFAIPLQLGMITQTKKKDDDPSEPAELHTPENIRKMYEESPKAMERLEALAREMEELKVI